MKTLKLLNLLLLGAMAGGSTLAAGGDDAAAAVEKQVDGLWMYTGLTSSDGQEMPLTGIFLFKDGTFVQQAVFDGVPFEEQGAMAHAGPYEGKSDHVYLLAEQTISTAPGENRPLSFRADTEHHVTVDRQGDDLTLVFSMGTGTVQEFERVGPGEGELYDLADGALAFVDGHFLLVEGDEQAVVTGYGTYDRDGSDLQLNVIRWSEADASGATNLKDTTLQATFDGKVLALADGRRFEVVAD
ncbi:MAG TPA: hypothetical protein VHG33_03180 [Woeseiaceae bacterium]|nr:hypothetical protein [Woeseiaceae bacterium]